MIFLLLILVYQILTFLLIREKFKTTTIVQEMDQTMGATMIAEAKHTARSVAGKTETQIFKWHWLVIT